MLKPKGCRFKRSQRSALLLGGARRHAHGRPKLCLKNQQELTDMLDKNRIIELIQATNKSSNREWLEQFDCDDLRLYLDHLDMTLEPRGGQSSWTRRGDTPAVVWRKAG